MKQVRETTAGKSLNVYTVSKEGNIVAVIHAHYSSSGVCRVDVYDSTKLLFQGRESGFGYDKFTAALSGAVIEGVPLTRECEPLPYPDGLDYFPERFQPPKGYLLCNVVEGDYKRCYRKAGLSVLGDFGMKVEKVL